MFGPSKTVNSVSNISQATFIATKQWIYEVSERIARSHAEARILAFQTTLWLEYLVLNQFTFSVALNTKYIQLFALLLLNAAIEISKELRARCSTQSLMNLTQNIFSNEEVYKLYGEIEALDLKNLVKNEILLKQFEELLKMLPEQTNQIRNVALILIDAFNLQFFAILANKRKVAAAAIAVTRFWIYEKEEEKWPLEFSQLTGLTLSEFKEEYDQIYCLAYIINQKNLEKKRQAEISGIPIN